MGRPSNMLDLAWLISWLLSHCTAKLLSYTAFVDITHWWMRVIRVRAA
jgi:hypothetical protein